MGQSTALAIQAFQENQHVEPRDGIYTAQLYTVEPINGGLRCYGKGFDFSLRMDYDTPESYVDEYHRTVYPDVACDLDLAIVVFRDHVALQKIVKGPNAPTEFVTYVEGDVPDFLSLVDSPEAIDNFYGEPQTGRVTKRDLKRDVVSGQDSSCGKIYQWIEHQVYREDPRTRIRHVTDQVAYPIRLHVNYNLQLDGASNADEARVVQENDDTSLTSSGYANANLGVIGNEDRIIGIVFPMTVAQGVTIDDATLTIYNEANAIGSPGNITIYGDDGLTQSNFGASDRPSQATKTTASATLSSGSTTSGGSLAIDITTIVQEIVDDAGWSSGDLIRFIVEHPESSNYNGRFITNCNNYSTRTQEPTLDVNYTVGGGGAWPKGRVFTGSFAGPFGGPTG